MQVYNIKKEALVNNWLNNISIRKSLIAVISISLITLSIVTIALNSNIFTTVFEKNIEQDLLPNQLAKVEARIRAQLSTPLELAKSIKQNKYLIDWAMAGEPESGQQHVIYPSHLKMQDSASRERVSAKALIEENGCSIVEINNAGDDPLSACPKGVKLENQLRVAALDKGITIVFVLRLDLIS